RHSSAWLATNPETRESSGFLLFKQANDHETQRNDVVDGNYEPRIRIAAARLVEPRCAGGGTGHVMLPDLPQAALRGEDRTGGAAGRDSAGSVVASGAHQRRESLHRRRGDFRD